jgi:hypothetical protein
MSSSPGLLAGRCQPLFTDRDVTAPTIKFQLDPWLSPQFPLKETSLLLRHFFSLMDRLFASIKKPHSALPLWAHEGWQPLTLSRKGQQLRP